MWHLNLPDQLNSESARRNLRGSSTSRRTSRKEDSYDCPVIHSIPFGYLLIRLSTRSTSVHYVPAREKRSVSLKYLCEKTDWLFVLLLAALTQQVPTFILSDKCWIKVLLGTSVLLIRDNKRTGIPTNVQDTRNHACNQDLTICMWRPVLTALTRYTPHSCENEAFFRPLVYSRIIFARIGQRGHIWLAEVFSLLGRA